MIKIIQIALFPFALIYGGILNIRHLLFDKGILKSYNFEVPIIGVGNLSFGGSGKSPFILYLAEIAVSKGKNVAIVSRGYGRNSKGLIYCNASHTSQEIGDEPKMYITKLDNVQVVVCEKRITAINSLLNSVSKPDLILLDDCYQHRQVVPHLLFLLTTAQSPYWKDSLVPSGYLRDVKSASKRADSLVITKNNSEKEIKTPLHWQSKSVFFSNIEYQKLFESENRNSKIIGFSGLAEDDLIRQHLDAKHQLLKFFSFRDHHNFTDIELSQIISSGSKEREEVYFVTTEKDYARLTLEQINAFRGKLLLLKITTPVSNEKRFIQFLSDKKVI